MDVFKEGISAKSEKKIHRKALKIALYCILQIILNHFSCVIKIVLINCDKPYGTFFS